MDILGGMVEQAMSILEASPLVLAILIPLSYVKIESSSGGGGLSDCIIGRTCNFGV